MNNNNNNNDGRNNINGDGNGSSWAVAYARGAAASEHDADVGAPSSHVQTISHVTPTSQFRKNEVNLEEECKKYGVKYVPPQFSAVSPALAATHTYPLQQQARPQQQQPTPTSNYTPALPATQTYRMQQQIHPHQQPQQLNSILSPLQHSSTLSNNTTLALAAAQVNPMQQQLGLRVQHYPSPALAQQQQAQAYQQHAIMCNGITINVIRVARIQDKEDVERGFFCLLGNAIRYQARVRSHNQGQWLHGHEVLGFLTDEMMSNLMWQCVDINGIIGFRYNEKCAIHITPDHQICNGCEQYQRNFFRMCRREVLAKEGGGSHKGPISHMTYSSPTIIRNRLEDQSSAINTLRTSRRNLNRTIDHLRATREVIPNVDENILLGDEADFKRQYKEMMDGEGDVTRQDIFRILFDEMAVVRKRKEKFGHGKGWEWSPIMIQFCVFVRFGNGAGSGMNKTMWDFIAQVFNVPPNQTLMKYAHTDTSSPDGVCMETLIQMAEWIDKLTGGDLNHPIRYGKLSVDAHTVKERFGAYRCIVNAQ